MALRDMAHLVYAYQDMGPIRPAQSELGNQEISRPCHLGKLSKLAKLGKCQETNQISSVRPRGRNTLPSFDSSDKMELVASSHGR
jgi:hypothetical protein